MKLLKHTRAIIMTMIYSPLILFDKVCGPLGGYPGLEFGQTYKEELEK